MSPAYAPMSPAYEPNNSNSIPYAPMSPAYEPNNSETNLSSNNNTNYLEKTITNNSSTIDNKNINNSIPSIFKPQETKNENEKEDENENENENENKIVNNSSDLNIEENSKISEKTNNDIKKINL